MDRRTFLALSGLSVAGAACARVRGRAVAPLPDPFRSLAGEFEGATNDLNVFLGGQEFLAARDQRVPLGLVDADGFSVEGGAARAWIGGTTSAAGPFPVRYDAYTDVLLPGDPAGFHVTTLPFPDEDLVTVLVEMDGHWGTAVTRARREPHVPGIGQRAPSIATPTFGNARGVANVCTREPACPMHDVRLDRALGARTPVVLTISSPKYCSSRTCGPVVDEVTAVRAQHSDGAAFIHAEVYETDAPTFLSPTSEAYRLESEPWTFVIDARGRVAARFEGPVIARDIEDALRELPS